MPYKNILGWCLVAVLFILYLADMANKIFMEHGWDVLWIMPVTVLGVIAFWTFIYPEAEQEEGSDDSEELDDTPEESLDDDDDWE